MLKTDHDRGKKIYVYYRIARMSQNTIWQLKITAIAIQELKKIKSISKTNVQNCYKMKTSSRFIFLFNFYFPVLLQECHCMKTTLEWFTCMHLSLHNIESFCDANIRFVTYNPCMKSTELLISRGFFFLADLFRLIFFSFTRLIMLCIHNTEYINFIQLIFFLLFRFIWLSYYT